jgi:hypothetical protein
MEECPICLLGFENQSYLSTCFHSFCYRCIKKWCLISPYCPLCKCKADSIVHSIISNSEFQIYQIAQSSTKPIVISRQRQVVNWGRISDSDRRWIEELEMRRNVYLTKKRAKLRGVTTNSKIVDFSPLYFKKNPEKIRILTGWIRRELNAVIPNSPVELIRNFIEALIQTHHIQSEIAHQLVSEYLGDHTELFIHELVSFAKSSFSIQDYDCYVQYE